MILSLQATSPLDAWTQVLRALWQNTPPCDGELARDTILALEITDITGDAHTEDFPFTPQEMEQINHYLITGEGREHVTHEWSILYGDRIRAHDQLSNIIAYLQKKPQGKRAQISLWSPVDDLYGPIAPCLQLLWFQIKNNALELHVHMRASDAYGKLLMNINEFIALQKFVADQLHVTYGHYYMFVDTLHIAETDAQTVSELIKKL